MDEGVLQGEPAAEGMSHQVTALDSAGRQEILDEAEEDFGGVIDVGFIGKTETDEIRCEDTVICRKGFDIVFPDVGRVSQAVEEQYGSS